MPSSLVPALRPARTRTAPRLLGAGATLAAGGLLALSLAPGASAASTVGLKTAGSFAVLAGTEVTNTGTTTITGRDLGVSPGDAVSGLPPGTPTGGAQHIGDAVALQAQNDLVTAYDQAAGALPVTDETGTDLGGLTLLPGNYRDTSSMALTGTLTLDAQGDADAVFVFQAGTTLITASSATVALVNGAQACNVYWQVGSSATLGTATTFVGTIMALTSADLDTGASLAGRVLVRNGAVNLHSNTITSPACTTPDTPTGGTPTPGTPTAGTPGGGVPTAGTPTSSATPTGTPSSSTGGTSGGTSGDTDVVVPVGHPHTGRAPESHDVRGPLGLAALLLGGVTAGAGIVVRRRQHATR